MLKIDIRGHDWSEAYQLEQRFRYIFSEQASRGWYMDTKKMNEVKDDLDEKLMECYNKVRSTSPNIVVNQKELKKPIKQDGSPSADTVKWWNGLGSDRVRPIDEVVGWFTRISIESINPNSPPQRVKALLKTGWTPTEWNYEKDKLGNTIYVDRKPIKKSAKITDDSVLRSPLGQLIKRYGKIKRVSSQLKGFFRDLRDDGSLETAGNTVGCITGRTQQYTVVNVPRVSSFYGKEMRSIFTHREGYILLGADLASLENRLMGHYVWDIQGGQEFSKRLLEECPKETTVRLFKELNINTETAKTCNYALGYGAGVKKLSAILDCKQNVASRLKNAWWDTKKPLVELQKKLELASQGRHPMWIKTLDGRKIFGREKKDLVSNLIQSAGAIVNKFITVEIHKEITSRGIEDIHQISNFHDEINFELKKEKVDILKLIIYNSISKCNNHFNFHVPMEMEIKTGQDWSQIH